MVTIDKNKEYVIFVLDFKLVISLIDLEEMYVKIQYLLRR